MANIIITGGAGFIGSNLTEKLLQKGNQVTVVDNLITSNGENIKKFKKNSNFNFIRHDITRPLPAKFFNKSRLINVIFHLACPTGVPNTKKLAEEMLLTCSYGTRNVLELAKSKNARVIFTSSSEVYGEPLVFPQKETYTGNVDPIGLRSPYEEGKRFSEALSIAYVRKYNLNASIVRLFNTYGPGMSKSDLRVIPNFLKQISLKKPIIIYGSGNHKRTFCYIYDLIAGLILVSEKGKSGEVYNIGGIQEITILDLAKLVIKLSSSKSKIVFKDNPVPDHTRRLPEISKIKKLGWSPKTDFNKGIKLTMDWYSL